MTNEIKRDIGTIDLGALEQLRRQHIFDFLRLDITDLVLPTLNFRFSQLPAVWVGNIAGSDETWNPYDFLPGGLSQTNTSILEVSSVSFRNLDGYWARVDLAYGLQNRRVTIWRAQFDASDTALVGKTILFDGRIDEVVSSVRSSCTLIPFRSALDVLVPGQVYSRTNCMHLAEYKGRFCQYAGGLPDCSGLLDGPNGCRAHDNIIHFGAFPTLPKRGTSVVWGKNTSPQHYVL